MIEETYEGQLAEIAGRVPGGGCVVLLVPTTDVDQAAALANDLAQLIGREKIGHTLLFSLEASPSVLDHEIGVEQDVGVVDILARKVTVAQAAAHGRARGFIYVPAGRHGPAEAGLIRSAAWRGLTASAMARGATVLAFVPRARFYSVVGSAAGADQGSDPPRIDGVVWLGPRPMNLPRSFDLPVLGALEPPCAPAPPEGGGGESRAVEPAVVGGYGWRAVDHPPGRPAARFERRPGARPDGRRSKAFAGVMVVMFLAAMAVAAVSIIRSSRPLSLLPGNDPLWLQPFERDSGAAPNDSSSAPQDSSSASNDSSSASGDSSSSPRSP